MISTRLPLIALSTFLPLSAARADLAADLLAYYTFEATGTAGIANQIGGGATHNGSYANGTTHGVTPAIAGSGAGFPGDIAYAGAEAATATDRSTQLVGNALNIAKSDASATAGSGWFNVPTLSAATLGPNFSISAWFYLAPDEDNAGTDASVLRDYVFESANEPNFDVSFGTNDANGTTFVSWIGSTSGAQNAGTLAPGEWHHVVHVFSESGANTTLSVYVDGVKAGPTVSTATSNMDFTSLNFGAARTGIRVFDGMLDEVAVWGRSITPNEVTELHQRGLASLALDADLAAAGKAFVSVDPSDPALGETFGTGLYNLNTRVEVGAIPALGSIISWGAPFSGQENPFTFVATASVSITANFVQDAGDDDNDGLTNYQELVIHLTVPDDADTDDDGIEDGDEVGQTRTDPLVSQLAAVNYIIANLGSGAGPDDTVLTRNQSNNTLAMKLNPLTSETLLGWDPLTPASPGVSASASGSAFMLQIPATGDPKRFFRVKGETP